MNRSNHKNILTSRPNGSRRFGIVDQMGVDVMGVDDLGVDVMALIFFIYGLNSMCSRHF